MKKTISIYLTQNLLIIIVIFFLTWGISFLATREVYSIKDNEKVEIFIDTDSIDLSFKENMENKVKNDNIFSFSMYDNKNNLEFTNIYENNPKIDLFIISSNLIENSNLIEKSYDFFLPLDSNLINKINYSCSLFESEGINYGYKIYESNNETYNSYFKLETKASISKDLDYYLFINYSSKLFSLSDENSSFGFKVLEFMKE